MNERNDLAQSHDSPPVVEQVTPAPTPDEINRLEKAAWDADVDQALVWYRDQIDNLRSRLREADTAMKLDRSRALRAEALLAEREQSAQSQAAGGLREMIQGIREGISETVNCRKVKALGCDCRVGGETALVQLDQLDALLSASPSPSEAAEIVSLRDERDELREAIREISQLYNMDGVAQPEANRLEKLFDRYLFGDDEVVPPLVTEWIQRAKAAEATKEATQRERDEAREECTRLATALAEKERDLFLPLASAPALSPSAPSPKDAGDSCEWSGPDGDGIYKTGCGREFAPDDGAIDWMRFCFNCGKRIAGDSAPAVPPKKEQ